MDDPVGAARARNHVPDPVVPSDDVLRRVLADAHTIAVVGLSGKPGRPALDIASFLQGRGYRVVPVHPRATEVLGERVYPSLLEIPGDLGIDIVDVFRRAEDTPDVARDAVAIGAKALWLQQDIVSEEAGRIADRRRTDRHHGDLHQADDHAARRRAARTRTRRTVMTTWEYFVAPLLEHNPGEILNTFGQDGWELVSVVAQPTPSGATSTVAYLKRPVG